MKNDTFRTGNILKSKYDDIYYKIYGGGSNSVEAYCTDNIFDCVNIKKEDVINHFELIK